MSEATIVAIGGVHIAAGSTLPQRPCRRHRTGTSGVAGDRHTPQMYPSEQPTAGAVGADLT